LTPRYSSAICQWTSAEVYAASVAAPSFRRTTRARPRCFPRKKSSRTEANASRPKISSRNAQGRQACIHRALQRTAAATLPTRVNVRSTRFRVPPAAKANHERSTRSAFCAPGRRPRHPAVSLTNSTTGCRVSRSPHFRRLAARLTASYPRSSVLACKCASPARKFPAIAPACALSSAGRSSPDASSLDRDAVGRSPCSGEIAARLIAVRAAPSVEKRFRAKK